MSSDERKQFQCFVCRNAGDPNQYYYYSNGDKFTDAEHTIPHKHVEKSNTTGYKATSKSKIDYTQRDENMKKMQESKQSHEKEILKGQMEIAEKNFEGMKLLAESNKYDTDSRNANTMELAKVVDRLTEILQRLNLGGSKK